MYICDNSKIADTCSNCNNHAPEFFCNLSVTALSALHSILTPQLFLRGSTIFMEGQPADGVYLLCEGRVKLSTYSAEGRAIILRIAEPGELLGLRAVISAAPYEKTAQASADCRIGLIKAKPFLKFIESNHEAALKALMQVSHKYHKAHLQICALGLSSSAADKLAGLLLQLCDGSDNVGAGRISRAHTHGEIGEMIGTSRETVTRLLKNFRERQLITFSKTEFYIPDKARLRAAIGPKS